ncbi:MAG: polyprenyl synthetase family protein [Gemmatimonadaceae bacterium]
MAARADVEDAVSRACEAAVHYLEDPLRSAVHYALTGGGKRLRGMLVLASYRAAGGAGDASGLAAAVEMIHAYSLVHDDLPCMDDDDMRRGRPSTHRAYGVRIATAAGAVLIPLAAHTAYRAACLLRLPADACCTIVKVLMQGAGGGGMIGGQLLDLEGEGRDLSRVDLDAIHAAKTGALIASAVRIGGVAASVSETSLDALDSYGNSIGLAFQIMDDVLDVTASTDQLGKIAGRDVALGKSTYPALLGVEGAIEIANGLIDEACDDLRAQNLLSSDLEGLARFIASRSH